MSENRTKTGQFAKGKSGNPGGRPKYPEGIKALMQENTVKAVQTIIDLMDSENEKVALAAAIAILDRALGKPETTSKVELSNGNAPKTYIFKWQDPEPKKEEVVA